MKKSLPTLILLLAFMATSFAQTPITLNINHKMGTEDFALKVAGENNMGNNFNVSRLEYYISQITIVHDGGMETAATDVYILVNGEDPVAADLGSHNVTNVEGIKFSVGVDQAKNHLDPASFPMTHPLAPKFPSMHWGWNAGYRFIAVEGKGGAALNRTFELHGLGDNNYFQTSVDCSAIGDRSGMTISLDADYTRILENINVNVGVIEHGDRGAAKTALENFRDYVFSAAGTSSADDLTKIQAFEVFPNPTSTGQVTVDFSSLENADYQIAVTDMLGRQIEVLNISNGKSNVELNLQNAGMYLVTLLKEGNALTTKRLMVNF